MNNLKLIINRIVSKHYYEFDFAKNKMHILSMLFFKSLSDILKINVFGTSIAPLKNKQRNGAEIDNIFLAMPALKKFELPEFKFLSNGFVDSIIEQFSTIDFSAPVYFDHDVMTFVYEELTQYFFKGSAHQHLGEFLTPPSVCRVIAGLVKVGQPNDEEISIFDPCCGTGAMLTHVIQQNPLKKINVYGQDINSDSAVICRMNIYLHQLKVSRQNVDMT